MNLGIDFLPELDRRKTQAAVESVLDNYRVAKYLAYEEKEASTTQSYADFVPSPTNVTSDQTAKIAIHNVDIQKQRRMYCERIERAVSRLHPKERLLITERYMKEDFNGEYVKDYQVYNFKFNPPISKDTYTKIRWKAFYKLALILDIAVPKS
ncbi:transcriptional regulator [Paenibacillus sp. GYB004]|uniref:ArpU family phage packaging/lysis transcriptional regulator n=1 Tax=Paenibacillus sp. GYB004 TaxID=2994393 RepID=UPI002F96942A